MSVGNFEPPASPAILAVANDIPQHTAARVVQALTDNNFDTLHHTFPAPDALANIINYARTNTELLVVMCEMVAGPRKCIADQVRTHLDRELPALIEYLQAGQVEAGYGRALFERPVAGWAADCLVIVLPADARIAIETVHEVLDMYNAWVLGYTPVAETSGSAADTGGFRLSAVPPESEDAQILHIPFGRHNHAHEEPAPGSDTDQSADPDRDS